jgi:O-antigen/teichoic acid export membrane protein
VGSPSRRDHLGAGEDVKPFDTNGRFRSDDKIEGLRLEAIRGAGANIAGAAASFALQMGSVVILARLLTPADFGIVTMVTTFSLLFCNFGLNGFTELILQRDDLDHFLASNLFWINVGIAAILTLVFAGLGHLLARFYHNPAVAAVAVGMSLTIIIGSLGWIHLALLNRARYFKASAIINLISFLALAIVAISAALAGWHYWALVAGNIAQGLTKVVCAWCVCRWTPSSPRRTSDTGSSLKFAFNVYAHFAFSYSTRNTDNLLVGWRFGARSLGFYKKAYDLFVLPESQLLAPLSSVVVSTLSRLNGDREQYRRYFLRGISVLALLGMGIGMDFTLVGSDIIRLLLGPGWDEAGKIFSIFGLGIGVMLLYNAHGWIHLSIGKPERWFLWGLMEFGCTASLFLLMLRWGPVGIAFAWTASFFLLLFPGFWYAGKPINLPVSAVIAEVWKFFLASVLAGVSVALIARFTPMRAGAAGSLGAFERIIFVSSVFSVLYLTAIAALYGGAKPIMDTVGIIRELLPKRAAANTPQAVAGAAAAVPQHQD